MGSWNRDAGSGPLGGGGREGTEQHWGRRLRSRTLCPRSVQQPRGLRGRRGAGARCSTEADNYRFARAGRYIVRNSASQLRNTAINENPMTLTQNKLY